MDTASTGAAAAVADAHTDFSPSIELYTSRELATLSAELAAIETVSLETFARTRAAFGADRMAGFAGGDVEPPALEVAVERGPSDAERGRGASAIAASSIELAEHASAGEGQGVSGSREVANEGHAQSVAPLAATWREARARLDRALVRVSTTGRPAALFRDDETEWRAARDAYAYVCGAVEAQSPALLATLETEWRAELARARGEVPQDTPRPTRPRRVRKPRPWSQPALIETGTPRVERSDIATWDRALEGAPFEVIAAWTAVCEWVLSHPRNQGGEQ